MKVSTANMTLGLAESLERRGYVVEARADEEYVDVYKEPQKLEYWHNEDVG